MRRLALIALALAGVLPAAAQAQQRTRLTVYTALENEQLQPFKQAAEAALRDVEIAWVRDSTGVITARLIAERANPRADVVWGLSVFSLHPRAGDPARTQPGARSQRRPSAAL